MRNYKTYSYLFSYVSPCVHVGETDSVYVVFMCLFEEHLSASMLSQCYLDVFNQFSFFAYYILLNMHVFDVKNIYIDSFSLMSPYYLDCEKYHLHSLLPGECCQIDLGHLLADACHRWYLL